MSATRHPRPIQVTCDPFNVRIQYVEPVRPAAPRELVAVMAPTGLGVAIYECGQMEGTVTINGRTYRAIISREDS